MPTVTYNAQSFAVDGRRAWIVGASIHYARVPVDDWASRIDAARQAGFNTIETACPWLLHEPRKGRYDFDGGHDVHRFVELCGEAGMRVVLRAGPFIGAGYDGGGLPAWLSEIPGIALREASEPFLERAGKYLRRLVSEIADLQVTAGGPILLVQAEENWICGNTEQAQKYLGEINRMLRENGITVPIIAANDLWPESDGVIDTWRGYEQMLGLVRQLRAVQPDAPPVVSGFAPCAPVAWGESPAPEGPGMVVRRFAEILAAGGQPIVAPFHGGTNFGFLGGRLPGAPGRSITTTAAPGAMLGEAGTRTETYRAVKPLVQFASHFGHLFADLEPDFQPIVVDPTVEGATAKAPGPVSVVPLRGALGRVVFVFNEAKGAATTLLLDNGMRLPVDLRGQTVGWYALDIDLLGRGRLDYANVCPLLTVGRSIVVFFGPEKSPTYLSVSGISLQHQVPSGREPLVIAHKGITIVICNLAQAAATYHDGETLYVGIDGFDEAGDPRPAPGFTKATAIDQEGGVRAMSRPASSSRRKTSRATAGAVSIGTWRAAATGDKCSGASPRYASLDGPRTLADCGAASGYGWYRITLQSGSTAKRKLHLPGAADRLHLFVNGEPHHLFGVGPGADPGPVDLRLAKGRNTIVVLADNFGRFSDGNDLLQHKGLFDHLYEVKALRAIKPKVIEAAPVDPFELRGFIAGQVAGQFSESRQASWTFTHARKSPILVDVVGAGATGVFALNDVPIAYHAGATGGSLTRLLLDPRTMDPFKRGKNVLRFAPDPQQDRAIENVMKHTTLYECTSAITDNGAWSFSKWDAPAESRFKAPASRPEVKALRGAPCWWKATIDGAGAAHAPPLWFAATGLSKGQVFVNGRNLGRYFTATADGKAAGPQSRLFIPASWLNDDGRNELVVFDEHGFDPSRTALVRGEQGDHETA